MWFLSIHHVILYRIVNQIVIKKKGVLMITRSDVLSAARDFFDVFKARLSSIEGFKELDEDIYNEVKKSHIESMQNFIDSNKRFADFDKEIIFKDEFIENDNFCANCIDLCIIRNSICSNYQPYDIDHFRYVFNAYGFAISEKEGKCITTADLYVINKVDLDVVTLEIKTTLEKDARNGFCYNLYKKYLDNIPLMKHFDGNFESYLLLVQKAAKGMVKEAEDNNLFEMTNIDYIESCMKLGVCGRSVSPKALYNTSVESVSVFFPVVDSIFIRIFENRDEINLTGDNHDDFNPVR